MTTNTSYNQLTTLRDSETNEPLTVEDLGITEAEYCDALAASADAGDTGHIRLASGRRVYATTY